MAHDHADRRRARITTTALAVPVLVVSALFTWGLVQLIPPEHRGDGAGIVLLPGVVGLGVLVNLVAVYAAPSAHTAWRRGGPVVVLGAFALLFIGNAATEMLGQ